MEVVVKKTEFLRELGLTQRIVEKKNTIPILSNILVEAEATGLGLTVTDLEVGLTSRCAAEVVQPGAITVSAKKLFEVIRALPEEEVGLRSNENLGVTISSGRARFRLVGLDSKDFPNVPGCSFDNAWTSSGDVFRRLLGKVLFAVTHDDSKFPLSGVLLLGSSQKMTLVATDGHRLAIAEAARGLEGLADDTRLLIPRKALAEVKQIVELGDATISCEVKENHVYFRIGERLLMARMIEDQFPDYENVVPRGNDKHITLLRAELEGAVRRAALLSNEKARAVRFAFSAGTLTLTASNPDLGEVREEIPINYTEDEFEIAFNAQYLLDFLNVVDQDRVQLELKGSQTQVLMRPVFEDTASDEELRVEHHTVIMPMRL